MRLPAIVLAMTMAPSVLGSTITVNSLADSLATNGQCTLREAVRNANLNAATHPDCAAGSGADVINLPAGTITMAIAGITEDLAASGDLDLYDSVTINGHPSGTTIDGNDLDRIFDINVIVTATDGASNTSHTCLTAVVPKSLSNAHVNAVNAEAASADAQCEATGLAPAGWFVVGDGPVIGPVQ